MATATRTSYPVEISTENAFNAQCAGFVLNEDSTADSFAWLQLQRMKMMGQLTPYLVHEAIQPLTSICNYSGGMLSCIATRPMTPEQLSNVLNEINKEAFRASSMVKQLGKNSNVDLEETALVSVNNQIHRALDLIGGFLRSEQVNVKTILPDCLPSIFANPDGLEQVLLNLLKNAAEAMRTLPSKLRCIEISTQELCGSIQIFVNDAGPWIPECIFMNLSRPFFTTKAAALGMGLWASKILLSQRGGELLFQRRSPQGLTALARLPVASS